MLKALVKKQFLELNAFYFQDKKTGKNRSKSGTILFVLLFAFIFVALAVTFGGLGFSLVEPISGAGLDWLYFSMISMLALALGVFGSVFNTYSSLYKAKDNEMLLSMPIEPSKILVVRLLGVFAMGLLYESLVFIPASVVYFIVTGFKALPVICCIILWLVLCLLILVLTCLLGWCVAIISSKIKNKSFVTVIASLAFFAAYYFVYFKLTAILQNFAQYSEAIGSGIRQYAYPLYMLGKAASGDILSLVIITAVVFALTALTCAVLSKSFLKITTASHTAASKTAKKQSTKQTGVSHALFMKELRHFLASPTYMLNCGLGTVLLPITAIAAFIKKYDLMSIVNEISLEIPLVKDIFPLIICAAVCLLSSMNDITAPSVSLEGKSIWIVQSMPIDSSLTLKAKRNLHLSLTLPPVIVTSVILHAVADSDIIMAVTGTLLASVFTWFSADAGLFLNLKMPNLSWQNEAVPIKQSIATMLALFGGWLIVILLAVIYFLLRHVVSPIVYVIICTVVLSLLTLLTERYVMKKGAAIFDELG